MIRNGIATKVSAITTATGVKGIVSPNQESRYWPRNPVRPNASSSATPPTTGGSTSGKVTRARRSRCPANLPQGARIISPARGSTRKATATSAGASKGAGTDREAPPRAARRARSRAVRPDDLARVITGGRSRIYRQGFSNPAAVSTLWPAGDKTYATNACAVAAWLLLLMVAIG